MGIFQITVNERNLFIQQISLISSDCSDIYTYSIEADQGDSIVITLTGDDESSYYILNGTRIDFKKSVTVIFDTSLEVNFALPNGNQAGYFPSTVFTVENLTSPETFTTTLVRNNDSAKCVSTLTSIDATQVDLNPSIDSETTVQDIIEKHETRIDNFIAGGGVDGVISNVALSANLLDFTGDNGGFNGTVDLSPIIPTAISDLINDSNFITDAPADGNDYVRNNNNWVIDSNTTDKNYIHDQGVANITWNITHNLNKYPTVTVVDSGGTEIEGQIQHTNTNNLIITFNASTSGKAYIN